MAVRRIVQLAVARSPASPGLPIGSDAADLRWTDPRWTRSLGSRPPRRVSALGVLESRLWLLQRIVRDLRVWEAERAPEAARLLVISTGGAEANRAMGLRSRIALDHGFDAGYSFGVSATPSAVWIDHRGRLASPLAVGAPGVVELLGPTEPLSEKTQPHLK